jgi:hypothetical protein
VSPAPIQLELELEPAPAALDRVLAELPDPILARMLADPDGELLELVLAGQLYRMPAN